MDAFTKANSGMEDNDTFGGNETDSLLAKAAEERKLLISHRVLFLWWRFKIRLY